MSLSFEVLEDRNLLSAALDLVGVTAMRNDPAFAGIDGSGLTVAVIDTGVDFSHPLLAPGFRAARDVPSGQDITHWVGPHGTHVAGIIGARDPDIGIAPDVGLIGLQVFGQWLTGEPTALNPHIELALQWVLEHRQQYNIVAVNMSLGGGFFTSAVQAQWDSYADEIESLEAAGITVVSAAGNSYRGHEYSNAASPGILSTLDVGSVWEGVDGIWWQWAAGAIDYTTNTDRIVSHSQRPPLASNTIFAPGAMIRSTWPGNQLRDDGGTSMASPLVAGAVALMQEAALQFGGRLLAPAEVAEIVVSTADLIYDGDDEHDNVLNTNRWYPRLDVYAAVQEVRRRFEAIAPPPPTGAADPNGTIIGAYLGPILSGGPTEEIKGTIGTDWGTVVVGPTDVDMFRFDVAVPGTVTIELATRTDNPADFNSLLRLFNPNGTELVFDDDSGAGQFSRIDVDLLPGAYYVGVSGHNNRNYDPNVAGSGIAGATGNYVIRFSSINNDPNGLLQAAVPVDLGNFNQPLYFSGFLGADLGVPVIGSDVDLFRLVLPDTGRLFIDIDTPFANGYADTYVRVFNANGVELAANDNALSIDPYLLPNEFTDFLFPGLVFHHPIDRTYYHGHTIDSFLAGEILQAGVYYIGVSEFFNRWYDPNDLTARLGPGVTGGSYDLYVTYVNNDQNGSIWQAWDTTTLPLLNQPGLIGADTNLQTGELLTVGLRDVDFRHIRSGTSAILEVDVDSYWLPPNLDQLGLDPAFVQTLRNDPVDTIITLWDGSGNLLAFDDDTVWPDPALRYVIQPNTDYYVAVSGFGNGNFDPFQLSSGSPGDIGAYLFHAWLRPVSDRPYLSDDLATNAGVGTILLSQPVFGSIGEDYGFVIGGADVDIYRFTATETGVVEIRAATQQEYGADTVLRLFDAAGNPLASNDNAHPSTGGSMLRARLQQGASYFIGVSAAPNANYSILNESNRVSATSMGSYWLTVSRTFSHVLGIYRSGRWFQDVDQSARWESASDVTFPFGLAGDMPVAGDWHGDGFDDVAVFRNGLWFLDVNRNRNWDTGTDTYFAFGLAGDWPFTGDWNRDGVDDWGVFRGGRWFFDVNRNGRWDANVDTYFTFGAPGDYPVVADWNGDGFDDWGVFRNGLWYLDINRNGRWDTGADVYFAFGMAGDQPVILDLDGDGFDEWGVYRNGTWYFDINRNGRWDTGADWFIRFGSPGDVVAPGHWSSTTVVVGQALSSLTSASGAAVQTQRVIAGAMTATTAAVDAPNLEPLQPQVTDLSGDAEGWRFHSAGDPLVSAGVDDDGQRARMAARRSHVPAPSARARLLDSIFEDLSFDDL